MIYIGLPSPTLPKQAFDITGTRFGKLEAIFFHNSKNGFSSWACSCDCGNMKVCRFGNMKSGLTTSCGCVHKKMLVDKLTTHNLSGKRPYSIWQNMKDRCGNKKNKHFKDYGARGITVCERWAQSFENFWSDVRDSYVNNLTLDRIDNSKGYSPDNFKWSTQTQQARNRRGNLYIDTPLGRMVMAEACEKSGLSRGLLRFRLNKNCPKDNLFLPDNRRLRS